ncbi:MAG: hypothetical protein K0Q72_5458, partial [Armatimonadetes bacterium]|nr:hypothetical protein [Armatimonadota bacterium]
MGELVRAPVELPVGELFLARRHGHRPGGPRRLRLEEPVDRALRRGFGGGVIPVHQLPVPLLMREQGQLGKPPVGVQRNALEQSMEVPEHANDRAGLEEVEVVLQHRAQAIRPLPHIQHEIELRRPAFSRLGVQGQSGELQLV